MADDLLLHNWVDRARVRTSWSTDVTTSPATGAEQRLGLLGEKPKRSIDVTWTAWDRVLGLRLLTMIQRATDQAPKIPLYPDQAFTTASSSGTTINCPTGTRRFTVGSQVVIHERDSEGRASNPQFRTVDSKTSSTIVVTSALTGSYPAGSVVYPVLLCHKVLDLSGTAFTDGTFEVKATFEEDLGPLSLDPTNAQEADQVFVLDPDWAEAVEIGVVRSGVKTASGRGEQVSTQGVAPSLTFSFTVTEFTRDQVYSILEVFDGCRGALVPLWLVSPLVVFEPVAIAANHVDVEVPAGATLGDVDDYVRYLGIRLEDGSVEIVTVTGITLQAGPVWRIAFSEATAATLDEILSVTTAHHVRFQEDELEEEWVTDEAAQVTLSFVEVQDEATYGGAATFTDCTAAVA